MSFFFVVNLFDGNYFDNNDEVSFLYVCVYIYDVVIPLIKMTACL